MNKELTYYKLDEVMDIADITETAAEEDFANMFANMSALPGVYFYVSDNPNFLREEAVDVKLAFASKLHASAKKYEPILNAFEAEKNNLMKGITTTTKIDGSNKNTVGVVNNGKTTNVGTSSTTNSGSSSTKVNGTNDTNVDTSNTVSHSGDVTVVETPNIEDSTSTWNYDTPQTVAEGGNDPKFASSGSEVISDHSGSTNTKTTDGTTTTTIDNTATGNVSSSETAGTTSANGTVQDESTQTITNNGTTTAEGTDSQTSTSTTDGALVVDKLNKLYTATKNILELWINEFSAYFIYNVD